MKKYKTFEEYIQDVYEDELFQEISTYVVDNIDRIDFRSNVIEDPEHAELEQIRIGGISTRVGAEDNIICNTRVEASVIIRGKGRNDYEEDEPTILLSVHFEAVLNNGLHHFRVLSVGDFNKDRFDKDASVSRFMVPYIYGEDLEDQAEAFLMKYCPEVIREAYPLPIDTILQRMKLKKCMAPLDENIFGMTIFGDSEHTIYDNKFNTVTKVVPAGTILINPEAFFMRNIGSINNTTVHECVHWHLHHHFFELQKLLNGDLTAIRCEVDEHRGTIADGLEGALQWMEWQANAITPKILMPAKSTKRKMVELLVSLHQSFPEESESEIMEMVIKELASFFSVSKFAAKLRAIELGFYQAAGVLNFVDGGYLPNFSFRDNALQRDETYIIDYKNAVYESYIDPGLRTKIEAGDFVHVDYMICINDEKYVDYTEEGLPTLTAYAREHVDECCLKFKNNYKRTGTSSDSYYSRCCLCRDIDASGYCEPAYIDDEDNQNVLQRSKEMKKVRQEGKRLMDIYNALPMSFAGTLDAHMNRLKKEDGRKMTNLELSLRTGLSDTYIGMLRKDVSKKTTLETVCAICIGLHLHPMFSHDLIEKSGNAFPKTEEGFFGMFLIDQHFMDSLELCNQKLRENGFKEWGKEI